MPFVCEIGYETRQIGRPADVPATIVRWLVTPETIVEAQTPLAVLKVQDHLYELRVRFRCLIDRIATDPGERLFAGLQLIQVIAEGEDIPSAFAYCTMTRLATSTAAG